MCLVFVFPSLLAVEMFFKGGIAGAKLKSELEGAKLKTDDPQITATDVGRIKNLFRRVYNEGDGPEPQSLDECEPWVGKVLRVADECLYDTHASKLRITLMEIRQAQFARYNEKAAKYKQKCRDQLSWWIKNLEIEHVNPFYSRSILD